MADTSDLEQMVRTSVREIMGDYDRSYWQEKHTNKEFPMEVWEDLAEGDWLGITVPEEYGGQGLGVQELVWVIEEVGLGGGWSLGANILQHVVLGGETLVKHGSEEQAQKWLPRMANGDSFWAFGVTEPQAGLNTPNIDTFAEKDGDEYVISGEKTFTTGVASADQIVLLARTIPKDEVERSSYGLTIFLVDPDDPNVEHRELPLELFVFGDRTYQTFYDDVRVHESNVVGEPHEGLHQIFDTMNGERITGASMTYACGRHALALASEYADQREVFDAPISTHQAIQHPLADAYADLECARLMTHKASRKYDSGEGAATESNIANLKAAEASWNACEAAMTTFGGMSASAEVEVGRIWESVRHTRTAPVSEQMLRNFLAERELGLSRSY